MARNSESRWTRITAWTSRALVGALVVGLAIAAVLTNAPLKKRVGAMRAAPVRVVVHWPPLSGKESADPTDAASTWMPAGERQFIQRLVEMTASPDPFDSPSLEEARRALLATGWFEDGPVVSRGGEGVVEVKGVWRAPTAVVRSGDADRLVSRDGRLLRIEYPVGRAGNLRVVSGVWAKPPADNGGAPQYGAAWIGGDVQSALRLLELLRTSPVWGNIAGIDASGYMKNGRLSVVTVGGSRLVWGAPPGETAPGEQPDAVKLARLTSILANPEWVRAGRPAADLYTPYVMISDSHDGG